MRPIRFPVPVNLRGDEALDSSEASLEKRFSLAYLVEPDTPKHLVCVLGLDIEGGVGEELIPAGNCSQSGRFPTALRPNKHRKAVSFAPRIEGSLHEGDTESLGVFPNQIIVH